MDGDKRPTYEEIAGILRRRIDDGDYQRGSRLPTQARLAAEFQVERGTVRQALLALQEAGLLTNVGKGSPPTVAEAPPVSPYRPQPVRVALTPRLAAAFEASPQVRVDVVGHTSETLMMALGEPLRRIHEGAVRPESVRIRVLLPSRDYHLAFPVRVPGGQGGQDGQGGQGETGEQGEQREQEEQGEQREQGSRGAPREDGDDRVHRRWLAMRNAHGQVLRHNVRRLRAMYGIDADVTFRSLPFTPPMKLYLLNGTEALMGYYLVGRREEQWESETLALYDALGTESILFSFVKRAGTRDAAFGGDRDAAFVDESLKWFDGLWDTIATDLTLS